MSLNLPEKPGDSAETPEIDGAFLDKILQTDLVNIIAKANRGQPLTAIERKMIEDQRARLKESSAPPDFSLEFDGPASSLENMTQKQLATAWGVSLRTIKGWHAAGIHAKDPAPLTRPDAFPAWFARIHAPRECPERYRITAQRLMAGEKAEKQAPPPAPAMPPERTVISEESKGLLAMLERHRNAEARLGTEYMEAVERGDEVRASFLLSQWSNMGEKLRALEKLAPRALEELGIYIRKEDVARELEPLHRAILKAFRQELRLCRPKLKATATVEEWNLLADEIVSGVASMLTATDFREPLTLEGAA